MRPGRTWKLACVAVIAGTGIVLLLSFMNRSSSHTVYTGMAQTWKHTAESVQDLLDKDRQKDEQSSLFAQDSEDQQLQHGPHERLLRGAGTNEDGDAGRDINDPQSMAQHSKVHKSSAVSLDQLPNLKLGEAVKDSGKTQKKKSEVVGHRQPQSHYHQQQEPIQGPFGKTLGESHIAAHGDLSHAQSNVRKQHGSPEVADEDGVYHPLSTVLDRPTHSPKARSGRAANYRRQRLNIPDSVSKQVKKFILFIGYPRSCHSLVASLLDAHPNMVVSHEYDLIGEWNEWRAEQKTRQFVFNQIFNMTRRQAAWGLRALVPGTQYTMTRKSYMYGVPNQWQGNYEDRILVLGDKHGGRTGKHLNKVGTHSYVSMDVFEEISRKLQIPLVFVHVMRHPLDNIATMAMRNVNHSHLVHKAAETHPKPDTPLQTRLLRMSNVYGQLVDAVAQVKARYKTIDVRCEDMVADPAGALRGLCSGLGIACDKEYLQDCSSIVRNERSRTRSSVKWSPGIVEELKENLSRYDFIKNNYRLDGAG